MDGDLAGLAGVIKQEARLHAVTRRRAVSLAQWWIGLRVKLCSSPSQAIAHELIMRGGAWFCWQRVWRPEGRLVAGESSN
jgi:hypothetical protein